jgi:biotin carboxyl carrier protein
MARELQLLKDGLKAEQLVKALAEIIDKKIWFKIGTRVFSYDLIELAQSGSSRGSKGKQKSADKILAPMPGKITKVFAEPGQSVQKGEALLVMEAMKMEYTLKSDLNTTVETVQAKVGDQVTLGQLLIKLKDMTGASPA